MKSPNHPRPSGDRQIARLFIRALQLKNHEVTIMSELRAWEGQGNVSTQQAIEAKATEESNQIIRTIQSNNAKNRPNIWLTYHLYHKAPDWIGPRVAKALNIPYVVIEASYAEKQTDGAWRSGCAQTLVALEIASAIICLNPMDIPALQNLPNYHHKIHRLMPFMQPAPKPSKSKTILRQQIAKTYDVNPALPWVICVAMMRNDAKYDSYQQLHQSITGIKTPFQLLLIGDGNVKKQLEVLFDQQQTRFLGQLSRDQIFNCLYASDVFAWPAINEAICMAILEAQSCGLPVVAGREGAISDIIQDQVTGFLCEPNNATQFSIQLQQLLQSTRLREQFTHAAADHFQQHHTLEAGANSLDEILNSINRYNFS